MTDTDQYTLTRNGISIVYHIERDPTVGYEAAIVDECEVDDADDIALYYDGKPGCGWIKHNPETGEYDLSGMPPHWLEDEARDLAQDAA